MEPTNVWPAVPLRKNWTTGPHFPYVSPQVHQESHYFTLPLRYSPNTCWIQPRWWDSISFNNLSFPHWGFPPGMMTGRVQTYECILMNPLRRDACSIPPLAICPHGSAAPWADFQQGDTHRVLFDRRDTLCYLLLSLQCTVILHIICVWKCVCFCVGSCAFLYG